MMKIAVISACFEGGEREILVKNGSNYISRDGKTRVVLTQSEKDGVFALTVCAKSERAFDMYGALLLDFEPEAGARYMANYRISDFWCAPFFTDNASEIPRFTQCLMTDGAVILPVCSEDYVAFISGGDNTVRITMLSYCTGMHECNGLCVTYTRDALPYRAVERCAEYALTRMGSGIPLRRDRKYPNVLEYLGWCSWDAFMTGVSEEKLIMKIDEFKSKGIPVKWALIDDMWGDVPGLERSENVGRSEMLDVMHKSALNSFRADSRRFPMGLSHCIGEIKKRGMSVGMWHPTTGYWHGIAPDGEIDRKFHDTLVTAKRFKASRTTYLDDDYLLPSPEYDKLKRYYDGIHGYLKDCGADFVKVDYQSYTHIYFHNITTLGKASKSIHRVIDQSAHERFGGALINCMGASEENMWSRPESAVSRCSDDFQPENREWFTKHILQCAYNCLVQGAFYVCDWDMWWTDDTQGVKNSVLRAISGGPVYVSDTLGRSRAELLLPLCYDDGRILRTDRPAIPACKCTLCDPTVSGEPFVLWSSIGESAVIAAFNLDRGKNAVTGSVSADDAVMVKADRYVFYDVFAKTAVIAEKEITITLKGRDDFRLYTVIPVKNAVTFIGLTDKLVPRHAVISESGTSVRIRQGGEISFVCSGEVKAVCVNGKAVVPENNGILYTIKEPGSKPVDIEVICK